VREQLKLAPEVQAAPGRLAGGHVEDKPAEAPHVGPAAARLLGYRFGGHEVRGARQRVRVLGPRGVEARRGVPRGRVVAGLELRRAEIGQLGHTWCSGRDHGVG